MSQSTYVDMASPMRTKQIKVKRSVTCTSDRTKAVLCLGVTFLNVDFTGLHRELFIAVACK